MPITELGQLSTPKNAAELRDQFLRDLRLSALDEGMADPPVQPGTDWFVLGTAISNLCLIGFANITIGLDAQNILTAEGDDLDAIRAALALPEVAPSPASGKLTITVTGAVTIPDGTTFLLPNGLRGATVGANVNPADLSDIDVTMIDTGSGSNLDSGETVRFISPPVNLATEAKVSDGSPLTGGTDAESDERKRDRILNTLQNKPAGGNWGELRQIALDALGSVQDCYVYPALGGPGSALVVPVKDFTPENLDFSRTVSDAAINTVKAAIQAKVPGQDEIVVAASNDSQTNFTLKLTIPDSALAGGNGRGWTDVLVWPDIQSGDAGDIAISSFGGTSVTIDAVTTTAPVDGQTHIAWWSQTDMRFYVALVTAHSGGTGAWVLTLDRVWAASNGVAPTTGDLVSPAAANLDAYAKAWVDLFRTLGPGEMTSDVNRLPRSLRHPYTTQEDPSDIAASSIATWVKQFPEITDYTTGLAASASPSVPASVADPVNILVPNKFAIYKK